MNRINILLVDNNLSYLEIARKMLRFHDESFMIDVATSIDECIDKLLEKHYHLLLLDYEIDGGKGFDILSGISNFSLNVPVVMMLNEGSDELAQEVIARGAIEFIVKVRGHLTTLPLTVSKILQKNRKKIKNTETEDRYDERSTPTLYPDNANDRKLSEYTNADQEEKLVDQAEEYEKDAYSKKEVIKLNEDIEITDNEDQTDKGSDFSLLPDEDDDDEINMRDSEEKDVTPDDLLIEEQEQPIKEERLSGLEDDLTEPSVQKFAHLVSEENFDKNDKEETVRAQYENIDDLNKEPTEPVSKKEEPAKLEDEPVQEEKRTTSHKNETRLFLSEENSVQGNEGYTIQDRKGKFVSVNIVLQKKLNYSEEELLELTLEDVLFSDHVPEYYQWLASVDTGLSEKSLQTRFVGKYGDIFPVEISLTPERNDDEEITYYRGVIKFKSSLNEAAFPTNGFFDQSKMIQEMTKLIRFSYDCSLNHLLEKISQMVCNTFQFQRATLAILDRRRRAFVKQIMIGYTNGKTDNKKILEVPQEVIDKVFKNKFKVRVIYQDKDSNKQDAMLPVIEERRLQRRDDNNLWKTDNVIIFNLMDPAGNTFGYISMDEPIKPLVPSREIFHNMEIFTNLTSLAIENFYRYSSVEKRNRRLKRLLVTGNIFKLNLSGSEIMKDSVWSIKFSLDFNLVLIGMINVETNKLEIKAVACDDRIKTIHLKEISIPVKELRPVFKKEYSIGKSYFISKQERLFDRLKDIYYDLKIESEEERYWQWWNLLIVPIYEKYKNIVGFIIADDPSDCLLPSKETIHTLEIFANQLSIAIENRVSYLHLQRKVDIKAGDPIEDRNEKNEGGLNRLVEIFFK